MTTGDTQPPAPSDGGGGLSKVFAFYAAEHHPGAKTFREALHASTAG